MWDPATVAETGSTTCSPVIGMQAIRDDGNVDARHILVAERLRQKQEAVEIEIELVVERQAREFLDVPTRDGRFYAEKSFAWSSRRAGSS